MNERLEEFLDDDYYTFLNLPRNASAEQISASYKKLSRIYHPDKHLDPDKKHQAEILFNRTKTAYEVLSDPHKKAIYDTIGSKGLEMDGLETSDNNNSSQIREQYERLSNMRENLKLQSHTNVKGNVAININATEIFSPYGEYGYSELNKIEVASINMHQSIETNFTSKDIVGIQTSLHSGNGVGNGYFVVSNRRLMNKGWLEIDIGAGNGPVFGIKGSRHISQNVFLSGESNLNFKENHFLPSFAKTLAVRLDKNTIGHLTYSAGSQHNMTTSVENYSEKQSWNSSLVLGLPHCFLSLVYTRKLIEHQSKINLAAKIGTFGFFVEYAVEKKVSKNSSIVAAVNIGAPTGVLLKFKITRSSQTYSFLIQLSEEILPAAIFYATLSPIVTWFFMKKLFLDPRNHENQTTELQNKYKVFQKKIESRKEEALAAIELMRSTYEKIVNEERSQEGLIIIKALYGSMENDQELSRAINVTIPLQCLVKNGTLTLYKSSKSELPGFYDPCVGENKCLLIEYSFKSKTEQIKVNDMDAVSLPS